MAQYLVEILGDKLDLSTANNEDPNQLPSPETLKGKILVKVIQDKIRQRSVLVGVPGSQDCGPDPPLDLSQGCGRYI